MKKKPAAKPAAAPSDLSPEAAQVWTRYRKLLDVAENDLPVFEIFCESFAAWRDLLKKSKETGPVVRVNGQAVPNPYLLRADKEAEKVRRLVTSLSSAATARKLMEDDT